MAEQSIKLWARVVHGLEWLAAAEASRLPEAGDIRTGHRDLLFKGDWQQAQLLRCIDDLYMLWAELPVLDHTRASLAELARLCRALPTAPALPAAAKTLRLTASFTGRRNYTRFEIEEAIGSLLASRLGLTYLGTASEAMADVWGRVHLAEEETLLGLRYAAEPLHRRAWRGASQQGALHPPVAAAMALLAGLQPGQTVLDPFCGSGTLLIEAGLRCPGLDLQGYDIAPAAIGQAAINAGLAGVPVVFITADTSQIALPPADIILSNPPWGRTVEAEGGLMIDNLTKFMLNARQVDGRAVILADEELGLPTQLENAGTVPLLVQTLRVSGRLANLVLIGDRAAFSLDPAGLEPWWHSRKEKTQ